MLTSLSRPTSSRIPGFAMPSSTSTSAAVQKCSHGRSGPCMPGVMGIGARATLCCMVKADLARTPLIPWCGAAQGDASSHEMSTA
eukprot:2332190-Pyramimonas_sp.AAC.1